MPCCQIGFCSTSRFLVASAPSHVWSLSLLTSSTADSLLLLGSDNEAAMPGASWYFLGSSLHDFDPKALASDCWFLSASCFKK